MSTQASITPAADRSRLDILQALRGVAALGVLAYHAAIPYPTGGNSVHLGNGYLGGGWMGVDVFFCLSGFVMAWVHGQDISQPGRARAFALKRFFRIYPPYFVFLLITLGLGAASALRGHPPSHELTRATIWQSLFLLPPPQNLVIIVTWTLSHEALFYALFCLAIALGPRIMRIGAAAWVAGILVYPHPAVGTSSQTCDFVFDPVNLEFLSGLCAVYFVRRCRAPVAAWVAIAVALLFLAYGFYRDWWTNVHSPGTLQEKVPLALACAVLLYGAVRIELNHRLRVPKFLVLLGTASYSIYLVHQNTIRWVGYFLDARFPRLFQHPGWLQPLCVGVALFGIATGLVYYYVIERPLLRASRKWLGARPSVASEETR